MITFLKLKKENPLSQFKIPEKLRKMILFNRCA